MKKIWIGLAAFVLSAATITTGSVITAAAATTIVDNYGACIVASSDSKESNGWTTYYTKIGDGNGIMTFDLLSTNTFGYFGLICGDAASVGDMDSLKDYVLCGKDVKTTLNLETQDLAFEAGHTYKATFNASQKTLTLEEKTIGASDEEYVSVFEAQTTFTTSNVIGMAALSDGYDSATVIIDNLKISDLKGKTYYVNNTFDGNSTVKDGSMKAACYNTATDATGSVGGVYLYKDALCTVRFVDESGELIATQKVCWYGSATAPDAPKKAGYDFVGWSESLHDIRKDMVVYPLYEVSKPSSDKDSTSNTTEDSSSSSADKNSGTSTTDEASSQTSNSNSNTSNSQNAGTTPLAFSCVSSTGMVSVVITLTMVGVAYALKKKGDK